MRRLLVEAVVALVLAGKALAAEPPRYGVTAFLGGALNLGSSLTLRQEGLPDLQLDADYASRSFATPLYYAVRLRRGVDGGAWEVQLVHHKLFLENTTPEVESFAISHGYNLLTLNRAWSWSRLLEIRVGGGVVVAHAESVVRGRSGPDGYELTGPALVAGIARSLPLASRLAARFEFQVSAARANVPIAGGRARAPNVALHALAGFDLGF